MVNANETRKTIGESAAGKEIMEITPIILGGSPTDPANKHAVTRAQHIQLVRYWNRIISDLRKNGAKT